MPFSNLFTTELGIAGLAVSGLVSLLAFVIISGNKKDSTRMNCFQEALNNLYAMQKQEREEWREDANRRDAEWRKEMIRRDREIGSALKELTEAIQEIILVKEK